MSLKIISTQRTFQPIDKQLNLLRVALINPIPLMSLPPANTDPGVQSLREITSKIYPLIFDTVITVQKLTSLYSKSIASSSNTTLKGDIAWIQEVTEKESETVANLKTHISFINAQETITNKNEILTVFDQVTNYLQLGTLDDLLTTLSEVCSTLKPGSEDYELLKVKDTSLQDVVTNLKKVSISLKISSSPLLNIKRNVIQSEDIHLSPKELEDLEKVVDERLVVLKKSIVELKETVSLNK